MIVEEVIVKSNTTDAEAGARRVESSYAKSFAGISASAAKAEQQTTKTWRQIPGQFSKAHGALLLFDGAMAQMGGRAAEVGQKLAGVASLMAVGGAVGVAIAGTTVAIGLMATAWRELHAEQDRAARSTARTIKHYQDLADATKAIQLGSRAKMAGVSPSVIAAQDKLAIYDYISRQPHTGLTEAQQEDQRILRALVAASKESDDIDKSMARAAGHAGRLAAAMTRAKDEASFLGPVDRKPMPGEYIPGSIYESTDLVDEQERVTGIGQSNAATVARLTATIDSGLTDTTQSNAERRSEIRQKEADEAIEAYQRMASVVVPIVQSMAVGIVEYFERSQQLSADATQAMADGNIAKYRELREQQDALFGQMLKDFLSKTGQQLIGQGIASVASSLYPINPVGIAAGAAQIAIGTTLVAGSLAIPAQVSSAAGVGGGIAGVGGAPSLGSAGPSSNGERAPIVIVVDGGYSEAERILLLRRGIAAAQARGAI